MSSRTILWLYRQLLRCLPSEFRSQYGSEMETAFSVTLERSHRKLHRSEQRWMWIGIEIRIHKVRDFAGKPV